MKIRISFTKWFKGFNGWELSFIGKIWQLRIAKNQVALWKADSPTSYRYKWIFNMINWHIENKTELANRY